MALRSINPTTETLIKEFDELSQAAIDQKLAAAQTAYESWRTTSMAERSKLLHKAAEVLRQKKSDIAHIITNEIGKTLAASEAEIEKCAAVCDYYADNAETFLSPETIESDASRSYVRFEPLGVILAVMPWNFPLWQVFRFLAPALMAGNVGVLKHASNAQMSAEAIENVIIEAGFPDNTFQNLAISSGKVEYVIDSQFVQAVTLTGSEHAGSQVAMQAGKEIKKAVLELGGSDPFVVLDDANIDDAVEAAVTGRMQFNAGQSCISAKRFIVSQSIAKEFIDKLVTAVGELTTGDPNDEATNVGPLVNEQGLKTIDEQVKTSVENGAALLAGGEKLDRSGFFYAPTVLASVTKGMPVYDEEVFGPVFPVITFADEDEAIRIANDTRYGLGATIFSGSVERALKLAERIDSGQVFINQPVKSDPRLPFGGIKKSGFGRELSHFGIREFVNVKTISIK